MWQLGCSKTVSYRLAWDDDIGPHNNSKKVARDAPLFQVCYEELGYLQEFGQPNRGGIGVGHHNPDSCSSHLKLFETPECTSAGRCQRLQA